MLRHFVIILALSHFVILSHMVAVASGQRRAVISGTVTEELTGEYIYAANVFLRGTPIGTTTNIEGFYSLPTVPPGEYDLIISFIGYSQYSEPVIVAPGISVRIDVELRSVSLEAQEVVVTGEREEFTQKIKAATVSVNPRKIKTLPQMGEVDLFRSLQFLAGVSAQSDFASGLIVRGGNTDQNLILLDDITVYNPSHLGGFFSNFVTDGLREAELIKGGYSSKYGGRLSAVLDIKTKDGNLKRVAGSGEVSLISSKFLLEGPFKNGGWLFTARRTYIDKMLDVSRKLGFTEFDFPYYFYDVQANFYQDVTPNDRIRVSGYFGDDILDWKEVTADVAWGNRTISSRWRHIFNDRLFSRFFLARSHFYTHFSFGGEDAIWSDNNINDIAIKGDLTYYIEGTHHLSFGGEIKKLDIGYFSEWDHEELFRVHQTPIYAGLYVNSRVTPPGWVIQAGIRTNIYTSSQDAITWAPRLAVKKLLNPVTALNFSVGRYFQYIFTVNDEYSFTIIDNWVALDKSVPVQYADQVLFGLEMTLPILAKTSIEAYWKKMNNLLVYRPELASFDQKFIDPTVAELFQETNAVAWGAEVSFDRKYGAFNGNFSYTLAWVVKEISGEPLYWANWDRRHVAKSALTYNLSKKWEFGMALVYGGGQPYTQMLGTYPYWEPGYSHPFYQTIPGTRNNARLPYYQRLDFSVTKHKKYSKWNLDYYIQIVNILNRKNVLAITWDSEGLEYGEPAEKVELKMFPIIPTVGVRAEF